MSVSSVEFFGLDGAPLEADRTVQPARAITAGSSIGLAAEARGRGKELKGTAMTRDRIVLRARESRGLTDQASKTAGTQVASATEQAET